MKRRIARTSTSIIVGWSALVISEKAVHEIWMHTQLEIGRILSGPSEKKSAMERRRHGGSMRLPTSSCGWETEKRAKG